MYQFKPFLLGVLCALTIFAGGYGIWHYYDPMASESRTTEKTVPPGTVMIEPLPTYRTLNGINVPFKGKEDFAQPITGSAAKNITIISFRATGENAEKSTIKIHWEDGTIETVSAGAVNKGFPDEKRAKQIVVQGYSVHERKVFRDSGKPGILNWEIHYQPAEQ